MVTLTIVQSALFLLFLSKRCLCQSLGQILFDLDYPINETFLNVAYDWVDREISFSAGLTTGGNFSFGNLPNLPLVSNAISLNNKKKNLENANTLILIGTKSYFGQKFAISRVNTSIRNYSMNYLPVFDISPQVMASVVSRVHQYLSSQPHMKVKRTLVVLNSTYVNPDSPWEELYVINILLKSLESEVRAIHYHDDATVIARLIRDDRIFDIILMVSADAVRAIFNAAHKRSLLNWRYRWLVVLPVASNLDIRGIGFNERSTNITIIQFGRNTQDSGLLLRDSLSCLSYDALRISMTLLKRILAKNGSGTQSVEGVTGTYTIDFTKLFAYPPTQSARRDSWVLQVYSGLGDRAQHVGNVTGSNDASNIVLNVPHPGIKVITESEVYDELRLNPLKIITVVDPPFVQYSSDVVPAPGKDMKNHLEGFIIDITKALMNRLKVDYIIEVNPSGLYGSIQPDGQWSGLIRDIVAQRAQLAVAGFTITAERANVVDFLHPILGFRGAILLKKKKEEGISAIFQFLIPFTDNVWYMIIGAVLLISITLIIVDVISPSSRNFRLHGFTFVLSSLFQGSSSHPPDRSSSRIIVSFWWFFVLILTITYVANYSATRRQMRLGSDISSLQDLLGQTQYEYGTVRDTSYDLMFQRSSSEYLQAMNNMIRKQFVHGLVPNTSFGVDLVRKGGYALIWDNTVTSYYAYLYCLNSTGEFDQYSYGFVVPKNVDYSGLFNKEIGAMVSSGEIDAIMREYPYISPKEKNPACRTQGLVGILEKYIPTWFADSWSKDAIKPEEIFGVFLVMLSGCILSLLIAFIECSVRFCMKRAMKKKMREHENNFLRYQMHSNIRNESHA